MASVFEGFSAPFAQLMLVGLVSSLLASIGFLFCLLPGIYLFVAWIFAIPVAADKRLEFWTAMEVSRRTTNRVWMKMGVLLLLAFLPVAVMYLYMQIKIFSVSFPGFQQILGAGQPDFKKLADLITQIAKVSWPLVLLNKIVLLFNLPFGVGALMYAYEDLFGARKTPNA
jgi:hypothetical protein